MLVLTNFFFIIPKYRERIKYSIDDFFSDVIKCTPLSSGYSQSALLPAHNTIFYISVNKLLIFFSEMISVDELCNIAVVVGAITPATPNAISPALNPTMFR